MAQMFQTIGRTLKPGDTLKFQCDVCDHLATLTRDQAVKACGAGATPSDVRRRAKCKSCGVEGRVRVWI